MLAYVLVAALLALLFRGACLGRVSPQPLLLTLLTGIWLSLALWVTGGLLHAWAPIWKLLLLGLALSVLIGFAPSRFRTAARVSADFAAVLGLGLLSVVPVGGFALVTAALVFSATGFALDAVTRRWPRRVQYAIALAPVLVVGVMAISITQADDFATRLRAQDPLFPLRLAFAAPAPGQRVNLKSGAVAWMLRNPHRAQRGLIIFLHGNHPAGSWQPAAIALQGAMLRAGYDVLTVDHPGYGASSHPEPSADWTAWDPRIGLREALAFARALPAQKATPITLVAHSMGVDTALFWMDEGVPAKDVYLFAGAITRPPESQQSEVELWHRQRAMACCIAPETMREVRSRFYADATVYAQALPADHPTLHFARFGIEYPDVAVDREPLFAALSAPKLVCDVPGVTHYINTLSIRRFVLLDTAATEEVAGLLDGSGTGLSGPTPCSAPMRAK